MCMCVCYVVLIDLYVYILIYPLHCQSHFFPRHFKVKYTKLEVNHKTLLKIYHELDFNNCLEFSSL